MANIEVPDKLVPKNSGTVSWSDSIPSQNGTFEAVASGGGVSIILVNSGSGTRAMRSTDQGITWSDITPSQSAGWTSIDYGDGVWIAVAESGSGSLVMRSADAGVTWSNVTPSQTAAWQFVRYGNGVWIAVAGSGSGSLVMRSADAGVTWSNVTPSQTAIWEGIAYGNGVWIAVAIFGSGTLMMRSTDGGVTWSDVTPSQSAGWVRVAYGNGIWVALAFLGSGSRVTYSLDGGITWNDGTPSQSGGWHAVEWGGNLFLGLAANGSGTRAMISQNGKDWTDTIPTQTGVWQAASFNETVWIAVAYSSSGSQIIKGVLGGNFPVVENTHVLGAAQFVATASNLTDGTIPTGIRCQGMRATTLDTDAEYELGADLVTWTDRRLLAGNLQIAKVSGLAGLQGRSGTLGVLVQETTIGDLWALQPNGTATADNITVVNTNDLSGQWHRIIGSGPRAKYLQQATWYVDGTSGSDWDTGATGHALKSTDEIQRRWGGPKAKFTVSPTIYFMSSQPTGYVTLDILRNDLTLYLTLRPAASYNPTLVTAVLASYTAVSTTNREVTVISATVNGSPIDFRTYVGKRINFGGGTIAQIMAANPSGLGNNYARITLPINFDIDPNNFGWTNPTPTVSSTFTIESLLDLGSFKLNYDGTGMKQSVAIPPYYGVGVIDLATSGETEIRTLGSSWVPALLVGCAFTDYSENGFAIEPAEAYGCLFIVNYAGQACANMAWSGVLATATAIALGAIIYWYTGQNTLYSVEVVFQDIIMIVYGSVGFENISLFGGGDQSSWTYSVLQVHNCAMFYNSGYIIINTPLPLGILATGNDQLVFSTGGNSSNVAIKCADAPQYQISAAYNLIGVADLPRRYDHGSGTTTLGTHGAVTVPVTSLPSDAIVKSWRKTLVGDQGDITVPSQTTSGFTIQSTSDNERSVVCWDWSSPSTRPGSISF